MKTKKFRDTFTVFCPPLPTHSIWPSAQIKIPLEERSEWGRGRTGRSGWRKASLFSLNKEAQCHGQVSSQRRLVSRFTVLLCYCVNYPCLVTRLALCDTQSSQHTRTASLSGMTSPIPNRGFAVSQHAAPRAQLGSLGLTALTWARLDQKEARAFSHWVGWLGETQLPLCSQPGLGHQEEAFTSLLTFQRTLLTL